MPIKFENFLATFWGTILVAVLLGRAHEVFLKVSPSSNRLCIGECATKTDAQPITHEIQWRLTPDLSLKTRDEIYEIRKKRVLENPSLINGKYEPSAKIFGEIEDGLRWWGFDGYYQHLRSPDIAKWSIAGKSMRGEEIFNPFYLISVKPLTYTVENTNFKWSKNAVPAASGTPCPFWPRKSKVLWKPRENIAEVVYFISNYINKLKDNSCLMHEIETGEISLGLDPVNAQDLGFSFLAYSEAESSEIKFSEASRKIIPLEFYYHRGTSCRTADGCNNISPLVKELYGEVKTTKLPARLTISLWSKEPLNFDSPAEFKYIIHMR